MIDLNDKITTDTVTEIISNVGLVEAINNCHSNTGLVSTYQRVSHPIYGIYTLSNLQVSSVGYLIFVIIPSYHRLLWLKI